MISVETKLQVDSLPVSCSHDSVYLYFVYRVPVTCTFIFSAFLLLNSIRKFPFGSSKAPVKKKTFYFIFYIFCSDTKVAVGPGILTDVLGILKVEPVFHPEK